MRQVGTGRLMPPRFYWGPPSEDRGDLRGK